MRNTVTCVGKWTLMRNTSCNLCVWCVCVGYVCGVCGMCGVCVCAVCVYVCVRTHDWQEATRTCRLWTSTWIRWATRSTGCTSWPPTCAPCRRRSSSDTIMMWVHTYHGMNSHLSWREFIPIMMWVCTYHDASSHLSWHEFTPIVAWIHIYHDASSHLSWCEFTPIMMWVCTYHDMSSHLSWHEFTPIMTWVHSYHDVSSLPSLEVICFVGIVKVNVLCVSCRSYSVICVNCSHWLCVLCV